MSFGKRGWVRLQRVLLVGFFILAGATTVWAKICLPPVSGDRPRLHDIDKTGVLWLELLLRQHEVCWREARSPNERRIFAIGNSAIYGFPWPYESTAIALVNEELERQGVAAHIFNLGFVFTYQTKEAMILSEALRYEPDFIVYGVTLDDYAHLAPFPYLPVTKFFEANSRAVARLAADPPRSFEEPFRLYRDAQAADVRPYASWIEFRQAGTFVRLAAQQTAKTIRKRMFPSFQEEGPRIGKKNPRYDCNKIKRSFEKTYANWNEWSMLEYLAQLRAETGVEVLVVNWPVAHEPRGDCYNVRYPNESFEEYLEWMQKKADGLGLAYLDLHDLLDRLEFVDSVHPTIEGQRKVATRLGEALTRLLEGERAP